MEDFEWLHYYGPELEDAWAEMDDEEVWHDNRADYEIYTKEQT